MPDPPHEITPRWRPAHVWQPAMTPISSLISIEELCACGSTIKVVDADVYGLLAVEFWAERHKGHGWVEKKVDR